MEKRKSGNPHVDDLGVLEPEKVGSSLLEDQDHETVGRAHGEEVHYDGLDRYYYRAEDEHEDQEAETEDEGEDDGGVPLHDGVYVRGFGAHAADEDLGVDPAESGGNVLVADGLDDVYGGLGTEFT